MKNGLNLHMGTGRYFGVRYYPAGALSKPADRHEHYSIQAGPGVVDVLPDEMDDLIVQLVRFRAGHRAEVARYRPLCDNCKVEMRPKGLDSWTCPNCWRGKTAIV